MATVDFSGAALNFDMSSAAGVDHNAKLSSSPDHYSWQTTGNLKITALSSLSNVTANGTAPTGGTIGAINAVGSAFEPIFSITGLNVGLTALVVPGNSALSQEHFWETVLAGATTFIMPQQGFTTATVFGDFLTVNSGQSLIGGNDSFFGNAANTHVAIGDAITVEANARLTGGNDRFLDVAGFVVGDVGGTCLGIVKGGDDSFVGSGNPLSSTFSIDYAVGDVLQSLVGTTGGADTFKFINMLHATHIVGDVYSGLGSVIGGNDAITIAKTGGFDVPTVITTVIGDVSDAAAGSLVKGGNDSISVRDAAVTSAIAGDVLNSAMSVTGGDDRLVLASSAPVFGGPPALAPALAQAGFLVGDAYHLTGGTFIGGNDLIAVSNAIAGSIVGDVHDMSGAISGHGGNDTISVAWNQINLPAVAAFHAFGDFETVGSGSFVGGNDTITLNLVMGSDQDAMLSGDGLSFSGTTFSGGNDTIVLGSNRVGATNFMFGDAQTVSATGAFHGGNDNLTGSNGRDFIFGDAQTIATASDTGGNDVINGRGGNDYIDGGKGFDAAIYSTLNQAVFVNLNGIAGSAALPANWIEAIGQGSDQLIGIERIVGSQLADVVIGNGLANVFDGLGGNDALRGGGGGDSLRGGLGNDVLTGGANNDTFVFNTAPNTAGNRDVITDFNHIADTIQLENAIFAKLGAAGALDPGFFRLGATAADANDHIIYNQANGALFYDSNGNAAGGSVMFAVLSTKPVIAADDFVVI